MPVILERNKLKILQLTPRQKQCVDLLARGYTPKDIATILYIEPRTVNYHLYCALQRFEAKTYPQLIYYLAELDYFKEWKQE